MTGRVIKNIVAGLFFLMPLLLFSQTGFTEYGLKGIPQSSALNPAFKPDASFVFGLPALSSINAGFYNTAFSFNDIFVQQPGDDSLYFDLSRPVSGDTSINYFSEDFSVNLLSLGFRVGNGFMTLGIENRLISRFYYTNDLLKLVWKGNGSYVDEKLLLTGTALFEEHFNDYYAGISYPVSYNVDIGVRAHFLQGLSNINTSRANLSLLTESDVITGYHLVGQTDFLVETSGVEEMLSDSLSFSPVDYFAFFGNIGFSVDVGVDARIGDQFVLQASVVDLGKLYWYGEPVSYSSDKKEVDFNGIEYDFSSDNDNSAFDAYLDSLSDLLDIQENNRVYSSFLRTKVFVNGQYITLDQRNSFNLLFAGRFLENTFEFAISAGYTFAPSEKFAMKFAYNYLRYAPLNLGLGFYFNFKPFQFYFSTDNVAGLIYPTGQHYADFHFGLNILIPYQYKNDVPWEYVHGVNGSARY